VFEPVVKACSTTLWISITCCSLLRLHIYCAMAWQLDSYLPPEFAAQKQINAKTRFRKSGHTGGRDGRSRFTLLKRRGAISVLNVTSNLKFCICLSSYRASVHENMNSCRLVSLAIWHSDVWIDKLPTTLWSVGLYWWRVSLLTTVANHVTRELVSDIL